MDIFKIYTAILKKALTDETTIYHVDQDFVYFGDNYHVYRFPIEEVPVDFSKTKARCITSLPEMFRESKYETQVARTDEIRCSRGLRKDFPCRRYYCPEFVIHFDERLLKEAQADGKDGRNWQSVSVFANAENKPALFCCANYGPYAVILPVMFRSGVTE